MPRFRVVEEFPQATVRIIRIVTAKSKKEAEEGIGDMPYKAVLVGDYPRDIEGLEVDLGGEARTATDETEELKNR